MISLRLMFSKSEVSGRERRKHALFLLRTVVGIGMNDSTTPTNEDDTKRTRIKVRVLRNRAPLFGRAVGILIVVSYCSLSFVLHRVPLSREREGWFFVG